jgi:glycosyltransferase involved in cell wall biosynthesis
VINKIFLIVGSHPKSLINFRGELIKLLSSQGYKVHVCAPNISKPVRKFFESRGVIVQDLSLSRKSLNPFQDLLYLLKLIFLIRSIKPNFILCYTIKPIIYGIIAARLNGVKNKISLITGLGSIFQNYSERKFLYFFIKNFYKIALFFSDIIFFQNSDDLKFFIHKKIIRTQQNSLVVNGSGVDLSYFYYQPCYISQPHFLLIARMIKDKGIYEYVAAAKFLKKIYPDVIFSLVGWVEDGSNSISLKMLNTWFSDGAISYLGYKEDVRDAIESSSVFVLPSYGEGTPRSVLEAMAMGRPIITTDAPGCRETVIDGENGFLVPVKNVDALVEAMKKFIDDPGLIARMGARSRLIAEEKYDVHKVNEVMLKAMGIQ